MEIKHNAFDIGNDVQIVWPILIDGYEKDLTGQPITMTIVAPNGRRRDLDFEVDGNILMADFLAIEQKMPGWYHLEVCYNRGLRGQKTVYATNALLLRNPYHCPHVGGNSLDSARLLMPTAYLQVGLALNALDQKVENLQTEVEHQKTVNEHQQIQLNRNDVRDAQQQEQIDKNATDNQVQQEQIDANTALNERQEQGIGEEAANELVNSIFGKN